MLKFWTAIASLPLWTLYLLLLPAILLDSSFGNILFWSPICLWACAQSYCLERKHNFVSGKIAQYCLSSAAVLVLVGTTAVQFLPANATDDAWLKGHQYLVSGWAIAFFGSYLVGIWYFSEQIVSLQRKSYQKVDDQLLTFFALFFFWLGGVFWISNRIKSIHPAI